MKTALASFSVWLPALSASGMCSCGVLRALTVAVNQLASGKAPLFLQPFLAGGVSIALQKPNKGVRPLCCGDPIRRLVGKCFCLGGKDEISLEFKNKNFGVVVPVVSKQSLILCEML